MSLTLHGENVLELGEGKLTLGIINIGEEGILEAVVHGHLFDKLIQDLVSKNCDEVIATG